MKKMIIFAVGLTLLVSCKGRTTDTVEPNGDTVEVIVAPAGEELPDTLPAQSLPSGEGDTTTTENENV